MTNPKTPRHVEIKDEDDNTAAEAEVTTDRGPEGTVRTSMHAREPAERGQDGSRIQRLRGGNVGQ